MMIIVVFEGLKINEAATGYSINFIYDNGNMQVTSNTFSIVVGPAAELRLIRIVGTTTGGVPMLATPEVALTDVGGNIITTSPSFTVTASLVGNPVGVNLYVLAWRSFPPETPNLVQNADRGLATFPQMTIDKAGGPYTVRFSAPGCGVSPNYVDSMSFLVGIGPPHRLTVLPTVRKKIVSTAITGVYCN
jgi:hypothetical protein